MYKKYVVVCVYVCVFVYGYMFVSGVCVCVCVCVNNSRRSFYIWGPMDECFLVYANQK